MKFTISSSLLLNRLLTVSRVIPSKSTMSIIESFLFQISGDTLTIIGSDLDTTIITKAEISNVEGEVTVALPGKLIMDTIKEFSEQPINFEISTENYGVEIRTDSGKYKFIGKFGGDYPELKQLDASKTSLTIPSNILLQGINKTIFAAATEEIRPTMTGIFHLFDENGLTFVATDAHKLVRLTNSSIKNDTPLSFVLPRKAANLLRNILSSEPNDTILSFDNKYISYEMENYTLYCRQIEGKYPNYAGVIPQNNNIEIIVDRISFYNAIKRSSIFTSQGTNLVKLNLTPGNINILAQDIDFSTSANDNIPCQYEGEPLSIGFKASLMMDILTCIAHQNVRILLSDPSRAGLVLPFENEENEDLLTLFMPMIIND